MVRFSSDEGMIDIFNPDHEVEVILDQGVWKQGLSLWVNVDGRCCLRITRIDEDKLKIEGMLQKKQRAD